jgi:chemotaxis response regulator CheB
VVVPLSKDTKEVIEHVLGRLPNEFPLAELQVTHLPLQFDATFRLFEV